MGGLNMADDDEDTGPKYQYEGEYKDGMRHGQGTYKWAKMETDEEGVSKQALDDEGKKVFQSEYTGQYDSNLKDGEGTFNYPDGSKYQGNWRHDKRHGDGVYWFPNGDIYSGEWRFGSKHGRGTFIHAESNARLVGTFVDGKVFTFVCAPAVSHMSAV